MYPDDPEDRELSRRELIATTAFVPLASLLGAGQAAAQTAAAAPSALSAAQMKILEAFVERLIPKDELGPSAAEAGAQIYIDRVLAGPNANEKATFIDGLTAMDAFAKSSQGAAFAELAPEKRDAVITAVENGTAQGFANARQFFNRARRLTLEGMFGDPYYGGNKNFAGWDLIRYPGPRPATSPEDQRMNVEAKPYRVSAWGVKYGH
jgi:gluconate 2-dehydrogenase gamma chain